MGSAGAHLAINRSVGMEKLAEIIDLLAQGNDKLSSWIVEHEKQRIDAGDGNDFEFLQQHQTTIVEVIAQLRNVWVGHFGLKLIVRLISVFVFYSNGLYRL